VNRLKQIIKKIDILKAVQILAIAVMFLLPAYTLAAGNLSGTFDCNGLLGLNCDSNTTVNGFIKTVINWMLTIAFGVAVLFMILGGFWYITSSGNEEAAEKGKNTAINAIIGIVIIVLSWVIVNIVARFVSSSNTANPAG
jgi:hypothetical protein